MRVRGSAFNGEIGDAAAGASASVLYPGGVVYTDAIDAEDGTWGLTLPGNPGINAVARVNFFGRTRNIFMGERRMGIGPSWDPYWWAAFQHLVSGEVISRAGVCREPTAQFSLTTSALIDGLTLGPGAVMLPGYDDDNTYWIASWEEATTVPFTGWKESTETFVAYASLVGETCCVGVEHRPASERAVLTMGLVDGDDVETHQGTYADALLGLNRDFVPLYTFTVSGGSATNLTWVGRPLFAGRFSQMPSLFHGGGNSTRVEVDSSTPLTYSITGFTAGDLQASDYVCEFRGEVRLVEGTSTEEWTLQGTFGSFGSGTDNFNTPEQVAADSSGNVYIADFGNTRIVKRDSSGAYVAHHVVGLTTGPRGVCVDSSGNIYYSFSSQMSKVNSAFTEQWAEGGQPYKHLATDGTHVYALNQGGFNTDVIHKRLCSTGALVTSWGSSGSGNGQFSSPYGIATDGSEVYVVDSGNSRVQVFNTSGTYQRQWSIPASCRGIAVDADGDLWVCDYAGGALREYSSTGVAGEVITQSAPSGVAVASGDIIWVSNATGHNIAQWDQETFSSGDEWADLVVTPDVSLDGVWQSLDFGGADEALGNADVWGSRPEVLVFRGLSPSFSIASGEVVAFRVVVSIPSGSGIVDGANMQFRLLDRGTS